MRLHQIQNEAREWRELNFPEQSILEATLGVSEECGELAHAVLKSHQGIRGSTQSHKEDAVDACADIIIFLTGVADHLNVDLETVLSEVWCKVKARNWKESPETGIAPPSDVNKQVAQVRKWGLYDWKQQMFIQGQYFAGPELARHDLLKNHPNEELIVREIT